VIKKTRLWIGAVVLLVVTGLVLPLFGQGDEEIITVAAPQFFEDAITSAIDDFMAENPGVKVIYVPADPGWPDPAVNFDEHVTDVENYARVADVLWMDGNDLTPAGTSAQLFLDLGPLVDNDPGLDVPDFYPAMWQSFQWDRGIWALPVSGSLELVLYDRIAFDEAGLFYPDENWGLFEFENAANTLTVYDADGQIAEPGAELDNLELTFRALLGRGFYDPNTLPNPPRFTDPDLIALAELWLEVNESGILGPFLGLNYDPADVPLRLGEVAELAEGGFFGGGNDEQDFAGALLPGGFAGLNAQGFAVSAGTAQPELAYEFAKFLTYDANVANFIFTQTPARRSLDGQSTDGGIFGGFTVQYDDETLDLIDRALENAIPISELRYSDYLDNTITDVVAGLVTVTEGLNDAEEQAFDDLLTAQDRPFETEPVLVVTPVPTPVLGPNEISLRFGLNLFSDDIPDADAWNELVRDFVATSPTVGNIELIPPSFGFGLGDDAATEYDCYYEPFNSVPNIDLATVLPFDPFMDTDPGFDRNDFIGDAMTQMEREDRTWGYPIVIQPEILWFDDRAFQNAGVPTPQGGWSTEQFVEALDFLKFVMENPDEPTFVPETFDNTYILMLIAAFGGIPYDYSTNPPTINLTEPTNLAAIQQVLDLAKDGFIGYEQLGPGDGDGFGGGQTLFEVTGLAPVFTDTLNSFNFRLNERGEDPELETYQLTNYPTGAQFTPLSYTIGTAYITAQSRDPQACYEWINFAAQRPDLFRGLPARVSQINDPTLQAAQGEDIITLYEDYIELLNAPNAVVFPNQITSGNFAIGPLLETLWINRAFDNYVFDDEDLSVNLSEAELFITEYRACSEAIPPFDIREAENLFTIVSSLQDYAECAVRVDPSLEPLFGPLLGDS